jgi:hypothetical protein
VVLYLQVSDITINPLFNIPSEFEDMRTKNIIESITIKVIVTISADCGQGDNWDRLNEVLMRSGWFALKHVSLTIKIYCNPRTTSNKLKLEVALCKLPQMQFPLLSTSKSVSFKFNVQCVRN